MKYKNFYEKHEAILEDIMEVFRSKLEEDYPTKNFSLTLWKSHFNEDSVEMVVVNNNAYSSLGSHIKYEVEASPEVLDTKDQSQISYEEKIISGLRI